MFNSFKRYRAEKFRQLFIQNCTAFDTPRLESEAFPAECKTEMDVIYKDGDKPLKLDVYTPFGCYGAKECFILIHGGAFVYGTKKLDQNFGMHLAIEAGIPVVNVDYTLLPETTLPQIINEIFKAMNYVYIKYGFKTYHTVGDSAGGYLSYMVAVCARSRHIAHAMWVFEKLRGSVESANMICPGIKMPIKEFPGFFFENLPDNRKEHQRLPDYAYNLNLLAGREPDLRICIVTGEDDMMREQSKEFKSHLTDALFDDALNDGDLKMHHVFQIAHPDWPQVQKQIKLIAENAVGRR